MATPEKQIEFLTLLQRLLSEGSFVSTYKYALLLALADLCLELGSDDDAPLQIPVKAIGAKFIEYYWRQAAPYMPGAGQDDSLRQNTGEAPRVVTLLRGLHSSYGGSLSLFKQDKPAWQSLLTAVSSQVRKMPLFKLQTLCGEKLEFLYDEKVTGGCIVLKPGVAYCFRRHYGLIADLVKGAWTQYVRRHNADRLAEKADLVEFLFGSERANLYRVRKILREVQNDSCFYCKASIGAVAGEVDHFIPWSRYPVDLGHNFVLAHASCNLRKSDRLPAAQHLQTWIKHNHDVGDWKAERFNQLGIAHSLEVSLRIAEWAYRQTWGANGLTWVLDKVVEPLPLGWEQLLRWDSQN